MSINWYKYIFNTTLNINKITVYFRIQANDKALNLINRPKMVYNIFIKSNISLAAWCLPKMLCEIREWMSEWVCGGRRKWLRVTCSARYIVAIDVNIFFLLQLLLFLFFFVVVVTFFAITLIIHVVLLIEYRQHHFLTVGAIKSKIENPNEHREEKGPWNGKNEWGWQISNMIETYV